MAFTETPCFLKEPGTAPAAQPCQATIGVFQYLYMHILIVFLQPICGMESTVWVSFVTDLFEVLMCTQGTQSVILKILSTP
jgi:hypothetical protein